MRHYFSLQVKGLLLVLLTSWLAGADPFPAARPEETGLSADRLARIEEMIRQHTDRQEIAGAVSLVIRRGKLVQLAAAGSMDREAGRAMQPDTIFRIASMTKLVTSVAVLMLYEEGKFGLNDPVSRYLPEFRDMRVIRPGSGSGKNGTNTEPARRPITIRDLLTHTSGLIYGWGTAPLDRLYEKANLPDIRATSLAEFTAALAKLPLAFHPGAEWEYGYSTDVLGRLVEVLTGQTLDRVFAERIFQPLGMTDTFFFVPPEKAGRLAALYEHKDGKLLLAESPAAARWNIRPSGFSGGGGLLSTARDYAILLQTLLNGGEWQGRHLLGRKTVELMLSNGLRGIPPEKCYKPGIGFGLGVAVLEDPGTAGEAGSAGQFWWAGIYNTFFFADPREQLIGILMIQMKPFRHQDLMERFKRLALQAIID